MLEVKESNIEGAGLGVFATEDINEDTVLTEYYGSQMTHEEYCNFDFDLEKDTAIVFKKFYTLGNTQEYSPEKCGQMINDYSCIAYGNIYRTVDALNIDLNTYNHESQNNCNVDIVLHNQKHFMQSLKPIAKGEELYFHYGHMYWLSFLNSSLLSKPVAKYIDSINADSISTFAFVDEVLNFKKQKQST